jgi:predicted transcriptional regulator
VSVREVLRELNWGRSRPLGYTTVQTVMTRLTRKQMLARSRHGRADLYRAVAPDAASIAVARLLAQFGETAIRPFLEQVSREPELRPVLHAALSLIRRQASRIP